MLMKLGISHLNIILLIVVIVILSVQLHNREGFQYGDTDDPLARTEREIDQELMTLGNIINSDHTYLLTLSNLVDHVSSGNQIDIVFDIDKVEPNNHNTFNNSLNRLINNLTHYVNVNEASFDEVAEQGFKSEPYTNLIQQLQTIQN